MRRLGRAEPMQQCRSSSSEHDLGELWSLAQGLGDRGLRASQVAVLAGRSQGSGSLSELAEELRE